MIRTRFAPSPTGFLHVGGLHTALFAYLLAKSQGGQFLLRIEDTDRERLVEGGIENIIRSLQWVGIEPDEGVGLGKKGNIIQTGDHGPYIQSERLDIYKKYIQQMLTAGHAYYCFCSKKRLDELRKNQELNKQPTGYDGLCRSLSKEAAAENLKSGSPSVVRLRVPEGGETIFHDLIHGAVSFENNLIDDQVLIKADGFPTYHFAVVVDDHLMEITHVVRGEEWIPSTPKHILLYQAFNWTPPAFAHTPLLVNEKKQKLSKRHGDVSVEDFKAKGYLPEAMVNFIALLGWHPTDDRELFTRNELMKEFSIERLSKASAVLNHEKLDWFNRQYMMSLDIDELTQRSLPFFENAGLVKAHQEETGNWSDGSFGPYGLRTSASEKLETGNFDWIKKVVALERGRATTLVELVEATGFMFADELSYATELLLWKKSDKEEIKNNLNNLIKFLAGVGEADWAADRLEAKVKSWIEVQKLSTGAVLWPMRVALSGQKNSPGPFEIAGVLGREKTLGRLDSALSKLKG